MATLALITSSALAFLPGQAPIRHVHSLASPARAPASPSMLAPELFHFDSVSMATLPMRAGTFGLAIYFTLQAIDPPSKYAKRRLAEMRAQPPEEVPSGSFKFGYNNLDGSLPLPSVEDLEESPHRIGVKAGYTYYLVKKKELVGDVAKVFERSEDFSSHYGTDVYLCRA